MNNNLYKNRKGSKHRGIDYRSYSSKKLSKNTGQPVEEAWTSIEKIIKLWIRTKKQNKESFSDLKGYLKDLNIWILAYQKISVNKGALTAGIEGNATIDGLTKEKIEEIQKEVLTGKFEWKGTRRIYIPKPGKTEKRPLGLPTFADKLVQEVIRTIIEPIFESTFSDKSHGFRPGRSCHTAIRMIDRDFKSSIWYIEGDISKCYDKIEHRILISLIEKRIKDEIIIDLIKTGLKAKIIDTKYDQTILPTEGVPQGGILSPLMANIMLNELDKWIAKEKEEFDKGERPRKNPTWCKAAKEAKRGKGNNIRIIPRSDPTDQDYRKLAYVRYADDFLIGIRGTLSEAKRIKEKLGKYLGEELKLTLSESKTVITHVSKGVRFLGHIIWRKYVFVSQRYANGIRRRKVLLLGIDGDGKKMVESLKQAGYCHQTKRGKLQGKPNFNLLRLPQSEGNKRINAIIRGISNWWKYAGNRKQAVATIAYLLRFSLAKVYAAKFKLNDLSKVFKKGGGDLSRSLLSRNEEVEGITDEMVEKWYKSVAGKSIKREIESILFTRYKDIPDFEPRTLSDKWVPDHIKILEKLEKYIEEKGKPKKTYYNQLKEYMKGITEVRNNQFMIMVRRLVRGASALEMPCSICGSEEDVEMHHIKRVADIKGKDKISKHIISIGRKQVPLCRKCHFEVHENDWRNKPKKI